MHESIHIEFGTRRLPVILQTEAAECGLACLAMVASWRSLRTDLPALRARFKLSLKGSNLAQLIHYADCLQFSARPLRPELEELGELKTPCILHWDLNHFVVLKSGTKKNIVIHDPVVGVRHLASADFGMVA